MVEAKGKKEMRQMCVRVYASLSTFISFISMIGNVVGFFFFFIRFFLRFVLSLVIYSVLYRSAAMQLCVPKHALTLIPCVFPPQKGVSECTP